MHENTSKKGFTLVEIMIVVVIIGLLAAMAIPAFQKVRQNSRHSAMDNDARQLAAGAQQYMLENDVTQATLTYASTTGVVTGQLAAYVKQVGTGYSTVPASIGIADFTINHPQASAARVYNPEGQFQKP